MKKTLYMETTEVPAERTAAEVSACLIASGATQISCDYKDGKITGLRWVMQHQGQDTVFTMPARIDPIFDVLWTRKIMSARAWRLTEQDKAVVRAQAERVAWRQLLRWIQAQMAMIDCGMVKSAEVFFAYIQWGSTQTLFQLFEEQKFKMLEAPKQ